MYGVLAQRPALSPHPLEMLHHSCLKSMEHFRPYSQRHSYMLIQDPEYWLHLQGAMHYLMLAGHTEAEVYDAIAHLMHYEDVNASSLLYKKKVRRIQRDLKYIYQQYSVRKEQILQWLTGVWGLGLYSLLGWGTAFYFP
jgi:hypothetical protein